MLYNQPYDQPSNPNASYVNGNPSSGIQGSIIPAGAVEQGQRELVALIVAAGITPSATDLAQVAKAIQSGLLNFAVAGGTAGALTAAITPAPTALFAGLKVVIKTALAAAGATTLNLNGLGNKPVVWGDQTNPVANDWSAGSLLELRFDGTSFQIQGISPSAIQTGRWTYGVAGGTANALTVTLAPAPAALVDGMQIRFAPSLTNTGAVTINVNGLGAVPLVDALGAAASQGDLASGMSLAATYKAGSWILNGLFQSSVQSRSAPRAFVATTSGTWTVPAGVTTVAIEAWGGGGGGGGSTSTQAGSGGGGGGYAYKRASVVPGQVLTISIGAAGIGGGSGGGSGGSGGNTIVPGYINVSGGGGGGGGSLSSTSRPPGAGGSGVVSDYQFVGGTGGGWSVGSTNQFGGGGGAAPKGGLGGLSNNGGTGDPGQLPGGGGGGGGAGVSAVAGGAGAPGAVIFWY